VRAGDPVRRYGQIIGFASRDIAVGDHVHTHNLGIGELQREYEFCTDVRPVDYYPPAQMRYFDGYRREDGRVGTRNYVAILSTVNCSASVSHCFTTGRGSVFGCKPVPSIKLATNSLVYRHLEEDMDINCGVILEGTPLAVVGRQIFEEIIAVASGKRSKSELSGVGEEEFAPWIIGPVL
jgi:altronate dehydratase